MPDVDVADKLRDRAEWAEAKIMLLLDECNILQRDGWIQMPIRRVQEILGVTLMVDRVEEDD